MKIFNSIIKFENIINSLLFINYFIYQFLLVFSDSVIVLENHYLNLLIPNLIKVTFFIIIFINIYKFLIRKFNIKEIIICTVVGILFILSYKKSGDGMLLLNLFYICAFKDINFKKVFKIYIIATIVSLIIISILGLMTIYSNNRNVLWFGVERLRYSMGFRNRPTASYYLLSSTVALLIVKNRLTFRQIVLIYIINLCYFILTLTRGAFIAFNLIMILYLVLIKYENDKIFKVFSFFIAFLYIFAPYVIYKISISYNANNAILCKFNSILSGRLKLTYDGLNNWGIPLFGQLVNMTESVNGYNVIDSSFIQYLVIKGIVVFVVLIIFWLIYDYIIYKSNERIIMLSIFYIALISCFDVGFMALQFSPFQIPFIYLLNKLINKNVKE